MCRLLKVITKIEKLEPTLKTEKHSIISIWATSILFSLLFLNIKAKRFSLGRLQCLSAHSRA